MSKDGITYAYEALAALDDAQSVECEPELRQEFEAAWKQLDDILSKHLERCV